MKRAKSLVLIGAGLLSTPVLAQDRMIGTIGEDIGVFEIDGRQVIVNEEKGWFANGNLYDLHSKQPLEITPLEPVAPPAGKITLNNDQVADLLASFESAKTKEEMVASIQKWAASVTPQAQAAAPAAQKDVRPARATSSLEDSRPALAVASPLSDTRPESTPVASPLSDLDPDAYRASVLSDIAALDTLQMGSPDAPAVYAILDPTCPACTRAISNLAPYIAAGQVRVEAAFIYAVGGGTSVRTLDAIMRSDDPVKTYIERAKGNLSTSELLATSASDPNALHPEAIALFGAGEAFRGMHGEIVPQVPFFVYEDKSGIAQIKIGANKTADILNTIQ